MGWLGNGSLCQQVGVDLALLHHQLYPALVLQHRDVLQGKAVHDYQFSYLPALEQIATPDMSQGFSINFWLPCRLGFPPTSAC